MTAADLLTVGHFDQWARALLARVEAIASRGAAPMPEEVVLYSIDKLASAVDVAPSTVRRWLGWRDKQGVMHGGKEGHDGRRIYLQAFYFTSEARIPWPALLAYERGEDFDLATLPAPLRAPPAELPAAPVPANPRLSDPSHLRVA